MERNIIVIVMGTRPEVIKSYPVIEALRKKSQFFDVKVLVTAQHREMMDQALAIFNIKPDYDLDIMKKNQRLHDVTIAILSKIRNVFSEISPRLVLVQGDTTTTFAAALAAFYERIPIGHIEAGLRTYHPYYPFPEEMNRRLVSCLATFHFAPTPRAAQALNKEGIDEKNIFVTGNTVVDTLEEMVQDGKKYLNIPLLEKKEKIVLVTAHRRENLNGGLELICQAIQKLLIADKDIFVIFPIHLNPKVQEVVRKNLTNRERVFLCGPLDYRSFVKVMQKSKVILTDSGGIQEEAPSLGTPVVVLRNETERVEALEAGLVAIAGLDPKKIVRESLKFLNRQKSNKNENLVNPYGDGKASERIVFILDNLFKEGRI